MSSIKRPCPLCGETKSEHLADAVFEVFDGCYLDGRIVLAHCPVCGFVYRDLTDPESLTRYYSQQAAYENEYGGVGTGGSSPQDEERYQAALDLLSNHLADKEALIVDIGCARGGWLRFLRGRGFEKLMAVEPSPNCLSALRADAFEAREGYVEKLPLADGEADCLYASNVLEHIYDLEQAMREMKRALKDGGLLCIEVPEERDYDGCYMKHRQWLILEHINFFSSDHLAMLAERHGFTVLHKSCQLRSISAQHRQPFSVVIAQNSAPRRLSPWGGGGVCGGDFAAYGRR